mgnify:CR=1 FL=1
MNNFVSALGIIVFCIIAWAISSNRKKISWRPVAAGIILQLIIALIVFQAPGSRDFFVFLSDLVNRTIEASREGVEFVFGDLGKANSKYGFILAFQALPFIVVFAALMGLLYYTGVMPFIIRIMARFIHRTFGTSGAESMCAASNVFVGIESCTTIRPYLEGLTRSEAFLILVAGMSTVASSVMAVYVSILNKVFPTIAGHLISASVLSIPAAFAICKLMEPETDEPATADWHNVKLHVEDTPGGFTESIINGATDGGKLAWGVTITLLAFIGLLGIVKAGLSVATGQENFLINMLGYAFYPFAWLCGVVPQDIPAVSKLLGTRLIMTEIPAYIQLSSLTGTLDPRSVIIASYALCGFAHIASMAIFIGGISMLAPGLRPLLAKIGFKALLAATLVTLMTGAIAGLFCTAAGSIL